MFLIHWLQTDELFDSLSRSFNQLTHWIDTFLDYCEKDVVNAKRAARILLDHFVPFIEKYFQNSFSSRDVKTPYHFKFSCEAYGLSPIKEVEEEEDDE